MTGQRAARFHPAQLQTKRWEDGANTLFGLHRAFWRTPGEEAAQPPSGIPPGNRSSGMPRHALHHIQPCAAPKETAPPGVTKKK
jgi:hypothetical protein